MGISSLPPEHQGLLIALKDSIVALEDDKAKEIAQTIVDKKIDPLLAIKYCFAEAALEIGEKFDKGDIALPHLVMVGDSMDEISKILEKNFPKDQVLQKKVVVIATVAGDVHSVGKNLVATMIKSGGFVVHDLGVDVPTDTIVDKALSVNADLIALSSLLTTTMPYQKEAIDELVSRGIRDRFRVIIGGGPVSREYARKIGADAYAKDAIEALQEVKKLFS